MYFYATSDHTFSFMVLFPFSQFFFTHYVDPITEEVESDTNTTFGSLVVQVYDHPPSQAYVQILKRNLSKPERHLLKPWRTAPMLRRRLVDGLWSVTSSTRKPLGGNVLILQWPQEVLLLFPLTLRTLVMSSLWSLMKKLPGKGERKCKSRSSTSSEGEREFLKKTSIQGSSYGKFCLIFLFFTQNISSWCENIYMNETKKRCFLILVQTLPQSLMMLYGLFILYTLQSDKAAYFFNDISFKSALIFYICVCLTSSKKEDCRVKRKFTS